MEGAGPVWRRAVLGLRGCFLDGEGPESGREWMDCMVGVEGCDTQQAKSKSKSKSAHVRICPVIIATVYSVQCPVTMSCF
jgi:hypothetical protein